MALIAVDTKIRPPIRIECAAALLEFLQSCVDIDDPLVLEAQKNISDSITKLQLGITKGTPVIRKRILPEELGFTSSVGVPRTNDNVTLSMNLNKFRTVEQGKDIVSPVHSMLGPEAFSSPEEYNEHVMNELSKLSGKPIQTGES